MALQPLNTLVFIRDEIFLNGLKHTLAKNRILDRIDFTSRASVAVNHLKHRNYQVVLLDGINALPDGAVMNLLLMTKRIHTKIILFTTTEKIISVLAGIKRELNGLLLSNASQKEIFDALRAVIKNDKYVSNPIARILLENNLTGFFYHGSMKDTMLSTKEIKILKMLWLELSSREIAHSMHISERTLESYRKKLYVKTHTKGIVGLIKFGLAKGILES